MPLLITFKNSDRAHVIEGFESDLRKWPKRGIVIRRTTNGHPLLFHAEDVHLIEFIPEYEWSQRMKERAEQEAKNRGRKECAEQEAKDQEKVDPKMTTVGRRRRPS